jgi:hypothetical protein
MVSAENVATGLLQGARWTSRTCGGVLTAFLALNGFGSRCVILDLMEGRHPAAEQCDTGSLRHCAFEHF